MRNCQCGWRCAAAMLLTVLLLCGMLLSGCKSVDDDAATTAAGSVSSQSVRTETVPDLSDPAATTFKDATGDIAHGNTRAAEATLTTTKKAGSLKLIVGDKTFKVRLENNRTAQAVKDQLPLDLTMTELNGNEKYYYYSALPSDPQNVGKVHAGDVMLFQNNTLVIFYKSFETDDAYTRIGTIEDADGLAAALGAGDVDVRWTT